MTTNCNSRIQIGNCRISYWELNLDAGVNIWDQKFDVPIYTSTTILFTPSAEKIRLISESGGSSGTNAAFEFYPAITEIVDETGADLSGIISSFDLFQSYVRDAQNTCGCCGETAGGAAATEWTALTDTTNALGTAGQVSAMNAFGTQIVFLDQSDLKAGSIEDSDQDTSVMLGENTAGAGGDEILFTIDGVQVGSVEMLAGAIPKWTLDGVLDPTVYRPTHVTTAIRDATWTPIAIEGDIVYNSDNNRYERWNGAAWVHFGGVGIDTTLEVNEVLTANRDIDIATFGISMNRANFFTPAADDVFFEVSRADYLGTGFGGSGLGFGDLAADFAIVQAAGSATGPRIEAQVKDGGNVNGVFATAAAGTTIQAQSAAGSKAIIFDNAADQLRFFNSVSGEGYITGDGAGGNLPTLDSDSTDHVMSMAGADGSWGLMHQNAFIVLSGNTPPADNVTTAYRVNQIYLDEVASIWYRATAKAANPEVGPVGSVWTGIRNQWTIQVEDTLIPTGVNTIPNLSQTPDVDADVLFFINGVLDYANQITATGISVTVQGTFFATYGYDIQTTDVVSAIYQYEN